jgi:hypothetical protein
MKLQMVIFALVLGAAPAVAQDAVVSVQPQFGNGVHEGCLIRFDVAFRDFVYDRGRLVQGSGAFVAYNFQATGVAMMLKIGIVPLDVPGATAIAPTTAYFTNGYKTNADEIIRTAPGETPGSTLVIFNGGEQTVAAAGSIAAAGLNIAYTRDGGRGAQQFHVPITTQEADQWFSCLDALIKRDD